MRDRVIGAVGPSEQLFGSLRAAKAFPRLWKEAVWDDTPDEALHESWFGH